VGCFLRLQSTRTVDYFENTFVPQAIFLARRDALGNESSKRFCPYFPYTYDHRHHVTLVGLHICFLPQKWFQNFAAKIRSGFSHSSFGVLCHPNRRFFLSFFRVTAQRAPRYTLLGRFSVGCCHTGLQVGFLSAVVRFKRE